MWIVKNDHPMSKQENVLSAMFKYVSVSVFITTISNAKWKDTMFPYVKSSRSQYKNPSRCTPSTPSSFSTRDRVGSVTRNCAGPVYGFWRNFYLLSLDWILLKLWRPRGKAKDWSEYGRWVVVLLRNRACGRTDISGRFCKQTKRRVYIAYLAKHSTVVQYLLHFRVL